MSNQLYFKSENNGSKERFKQKHYWDESIKGAKDVIFADSLSFGKYISYLTCLRTRTY